MSKNALFFNGKISKPTPKKSAKKATLWSEVVKRNALNKIPSKSGGAQVAL